MVRGTERPVLGIFNALTLNLLLAAMAAALLAVLASSAQLNPFLPSPAFQSFLFTASAVVSGLIGLWLHREVRTSGHTGIAWLTVCFWGQALLLLIGATLRDPVRLARFDPLSAVWATFFIAIGSLLVCLRPFRKAVEMVLGNRPWAIRAAGWGIFFLLGMARFLYARIAGQESLADLLRGLMLGCLAVSALSLLLILRLYLRRRTPVILSFAVAQFVFGLSVTATWLSPVWHLLWWYGQFLYFVCLFIVGNGVLEGHRVREREVLIAELNDLTKKLEEQSYRDGLTGCYNRRYAVETLENEFQKARRGSLPLSLLVGDVDDFKRINDSHGHPLGDVVLKEVAARLGEGIRASDVLARCGGEEFWVILPLTNRVGGEEVAAKLLSVLRSRPFETSGVVLRVTMSIGIADIYSPGVTDPASLIHEADRALYAAKRSGKDKAMILDPLGFTVPQR